MAFKAMTFSNHFFKFELFYKTIEMEFVKSSSHILLDLEITKPLTPLEEVYSVESKSTDN